MSRMDMMAPRTTTPATFRTAASIWSGESILLAEDMGSPSHTVPATLRLGSPSAVDREPGSVRSRWRHERGRRTLRPGGWAVATGAPGRKARQMDESGRLRALHDSYAWEVNAAIGEGRLDLVWRLADDYVDEALELMT